MELVVQRFFFNALFLEFWVLTAFYGVWVLSFREDISVQLCMFYTTFGFSMGRERIKVFIIYQTCYFNFSSGFYIYI